MVSRQQTSRLMSRLLALLLLVLLVVEEVLLLDAMMTVPGVTLDPTNGLLLALVSLQWTKLTKAEMKLGFCSENSPTPGAAPPHPSPVPYYLHIYTRQCRFSIFIFHSVHISTPPPTVVQCTVGEIRVFCPMGVLGVFI